MLHMPTVEALQIVEKSKTKILEGTRWLEEGLICFLDSAFLTHEAEHWDLALSRALAFNVRSSQEAMRSNLIVQLENIKARCESRTPPRDDYSAFLVLYKASYNVLYDIRILWQRIQMLKPHHEYHLPVALQQIINIGLPDLEKAISFCEETHETIAERLRIWNEIFEIALTENGLRSTLHHLEDEDGRETTFSRLVTPAFEQLRTLRNDRRRIEADCAALKAVLIEQWSSIRGRRVTVEAVQCANVSLESYHCEVLSQQIIQDQAMKSIANAVKAALDLTLSVRASDNVSIPAQLDLQILSDECEALKTSAEEVAEIADNAHRILKELVDALQQATRHSSTTRS